MFIIPPPPPPPPLPIQRPCCVWSNVNGIGSAAGGLLCEECGEGVESVCCELCAGLGCWCWCWC